MSNFTPLKGPIKSKPFLVLDLESKDGDSDRAGFTRPFMCGIYSVDGYRAYFDRNRGAWDERYYLEGGCVDRGMRQILRNKYAGHHIYAHNAGRFDYLFLLPWLMNQGIDLGFRFSIIPVASAIQVLDVWRDSNPTYKWRFLDSIKLIPVGLDKAGKMFGLGGKLEQDLNTPESDEKSWIKYNKQDCVLNYQVVERFHDYIEKVLCGEVGITAPATAVKLYRRKYLKAAMPRNEETHDFVRAGYVGGRTEPFIREGFGLKYFDINSSYPAAMLDTMPGGVAAEWEGTPPDRMLTERIGFAQVDVHVPEGLRIPPLPVKGDGKENGPAKLIFPVGRLTGIWEWGELQQALSMGCTIHKWHKSVWYEPVEMFRDYVNDLYKYRDKSNPAYDEALAQVVKILLNATYGKFGMKTERKQIYLAGDPEMPEKCCPVNGDPDCPLWYATKTVDAPYVMPQIAARVTALARVRLLKGMLKALELGGDVYYCDTDSIVTNVDLPTSNALGDLKDEFPEQSGKLHGLFLGPKLYLLEADDGFEKVKAKGMQKRTRDILNRLVAGESIDQPRLEKIGGMAQRSFVSGPRMLNVPKRLLSTQGKRIIHDDGTSSPYVLSMW